MYKIKINAKKIVILSILGLAIYAAFLFSGSITQQADATNQCGGGTCTATASEVGGGCRLDLISWKTVCVETTNTCTATASGCGATATCTVTTTYCDTDIEGKCYQGTLPALPLEIPTSATCTTPECVPPTASISSPSAVATPPDTDPSRDGLQADINVSWSSTCAGSCVASSEPAVAAWSGTKETSGSQTLKLGGGTYNFSLTCTGAIDPAATASTTTKVVSLDLGGPASVYKDDPFNLNWATYNIISPLTKFASPATSQWQGTASSSSPDGRANLAYLDSSLFRRGTTIFSLRGMGEGKTVTDTQSVRFYEIPRCSFSSNPQRIVLPNSSTLSWNCKYANSCSIDQGVGSVSPTSGTKEVRPPKTTTYTLLCQGPDGPGSAQTTVSVGFQGRLREIFPNINPLNLLSQALNWLR